MNRSLPRVGFWVLLGLLVLAPALVHAQGFLIVTDADSVVRLPRPVIIYPPPCPGPRPSRRRLPRSRRPATRSRSWTSRPGSPTRWPKSRFAVVCEYGEPAAGSAVRLSAAL